MDLFDTCPIAEYREEFERYAKNKFSVYFLMGKPVIRLYNAIVTIHSWVRDYPTKLKLFMKT